MPRRWNPDPNKIRTIPVLLRDAQPTWREIDGEPNLRKRREHMHARNSAIDTLIKLYLHAEKNGYLARLDVLSATSLKD